MGAFFMEPGNAGSELGENKAAELSTQSCGFRPTAWRLPSHDQQGR